MLWKIMSMHHSLTPKALRFKNCKAFNNKVLAECLAIMTQYSALKLVGVDSANPWYLQQ